MPANRRYSTTRDAAPSPPRAVHAHPAPGRGLPSPSTRPRPHIKRAPFRPASRCPLPPAHAPKWSSGPGVPSRHTRTKATGGRRRETRSRPSRSPISRRGATFDRPAVVPTGAEFCFGMNSGAGPNSDGAARRRLPIASLVPASKRAGAVALVTERAPTAPPTSLLRWTTGSGAPEAPRFAGFRR